MSIRLTTSKTPDSYPIDPDVLTVANMMDKLLDAVVAVYAQRGVPLPARQYWMMGGEVPEDCEQVVVSMLQGYLGAPGDQASDPQPCNSPRTAVVNVHVTREYPICENGNPVAADKIIAASRWTAIDTSVLLWALDDLNSAINLGNKGVIGTVSVASPSGAVQTTTLNLSLMIN